MAPEWIVMRVAYMILFITLVFMAWAYMIQAAVLAESMNRAYSGNARDVYPPCSFNPLCTCSKPGPTEFGIVECQHVPFGNIPLNLNISRAFLLSMVGNDLQFLDDKRLVGSGLWKLEVSENNLNYVSDDAFLGLSKFLSELDLQRNLLTNIPTNALHRLAKSAKLKILKLDYNKITDIYPHDLEGLPTSITYLGLAGNMIIYIQEDAFANLPHLETINLSDNSIQLIDNQAFSTISTTLANLYMSNNLFQKIPFEALAHLKQLKTLDISKNMLTSTFDTSFDKKLSVGVLNLEYNMIFSLSPNAFQNFRKVSIVRLAYNPIHTLEDNAFKDVKIDKLFISNCFISQIHPNAFMGLENTLEMLDLSFNNISSLSFDIFQNFNRLRHLNLDQNRLHVAPNVLENFTVRLFTDLYHLSVTGEMMVPFSMTDIGQMRSLRSLNISNFGLTSLSPQVFKGLGLAVEEIKISQGSSLKSIKVDAFGLLTGLKSIDLSDNRIEMMDNDAFEGVSHSLLHLTMHNSFVRMASVPGKAIQTLTAVRYLDLSSNGFSSIAPDTFSESKQLTQLNLRFNKLTSISKHLFDPGRTPKLQRIFLSFNNIDIINEQTFTRLNELEMIELNENVIETIHSRAFEDLANLKMINLAGNRISSLKNEAFQNLPQMQILDLSHNHLKFLNLEAFEQLGTLSSFRINLSYNNIKRLVVSNNLEDEMEASTDEESIEKVEKEPIHHLNSISSSSIEAIDLSHNNMTFISPHFFSPISSTVIDLDLSDNRLQNLTLEHLSGMRFLQRLKLSNNLLDTIEYNAFQEAKFIQVINLDHNLLRDISSDLFDGCGNLRELNLAYNTIRALSAESIFKDTQLEILNVANNHLVRFPENALSGVASTLVRLDLSGNEISSLTSNQIECLQKLRWLDLSDNRIVMIADSTFDTLLSLVHLNLGGNPMGKISARLFERRKDSLLHLQVANMSLESLPEFESFPKLRTFNASYNRLTYLPTNFGVNVSSLRTLDISGNKISSPPNTIWHTIPRLSRVVLKNNPIRSLNNDSFLQLERLHELDISNLPLETVQIGVFSPLGCLKKITVGPLPRTINLGLFIQPAESLQELHLKMDRPVMSLDMRSFSFPGKVSAITVSGQELQSISPATFSQITARQLKLTLENTGLTTLPAEVLHELGHATQLSLTMKGNNSALRIIGNPNAQFRRKPYVTYLEHIALNDHLSLSCSCEIGWLEYWLRQWMEGSCPISSPIPKDDSKRCNEMLNTLRNIKCQNIPGTDLMQAFISNLECGWESSASFFWKRLEVYRNLLLVTFVPGILTPFWLLRV